MNAVVALCAGVLALAAALLSVTRAVAVEALLWLLGALLALAAAFFALAAGFAGVLQILIYAGAIVVVFIFVVMTLEDTPAAREAERAALARAWKFPAAIAVVVAAPFLFGLGAVTPGASGPVSVRSVGALLFGPWALVVELASTLLLAGLLGVRHLGRRDRDRRDRP